MTRVLTILTISLLANTSAFAQVFDEKFDHWPLHTTIGGTVVVAPALDDVSELKQTIRRADKDVAVGILVAADVDKETANKLQSVFDGATATAVAVSADVDVSKTLEEWISSFDIICLQTANTQSDVALEKTVQSLSSQLQQFVRNRKRLMLVGSIATLAGTLQYNTATQCSPGFGFLPDTVLATKAVDDKAFVQQLTTQPGMVGVVMKANTAIVLGGRVARVVGNGSARFVLPPGKHHEERQAILRRPQRGQRPTEYLLDWTEWRRDSTDRTLPLFPPKNPTPPLVKSGALLIVGGGGMPRGLMDRFVELAGGVENAKLVYVPCSEDLTVSSRQGMVSLWKRMGIKSATFIHTKDRNKANSDEDFLTPLKDATGIWFGGGRQWNMADSYYGTKAHKLMKDVLKRGGVIGGSSAGASIQARYLARATPIENFRIMAPGYERGGLGFISGVAIDQHFSQRGRQKDMTQLVDRYPQMLGIGLDEATAIEVQKSVAKVTGRGKVFFYDRRRPVIDGQPDYQSLPAGSSYDLAKRSVMVDTTKAAEDTKAPADQDAEN